MIPLPSNNLGSPFLKLLVLRWTYWVCSCSCGADFPDVGPSVAAPRSCTLLFPPGCPSTRQTGSWSPLWTGRWPWHLPCIAPGPVLAVAGTPSFPLAPRKQQNKSTAKYLSANLSIQEDRTYDSKKLKHIFSSLCLACFVGFRNCDFQDQISKDGHIIANCIRYYDLIASSDASEYILCFTQNAESSYFFIITENIVVSDETVTLLFFLMKNNFVIIADKIVCTRRKGETLIRPIHIKLMDDNNHYNKCPCYSCVQRCTGRGSSMYNVIQEMSLWKWKIHWKTRILYLSTAAKSTLLFAYMLFLQL